MNLTLTQIATLTKRGVVFFIIFLVLSIGGWFGYNSYRNYQLSKIPPVEELPDVKWGVLSKPNFPTTLTSSSDLSYTLNTQTGTLPENLPKLFNVFYIAQLGTTLLAGDKAKQLAANFDFTGEPEVLSAIQYRFSNQDGEMIINLDNSNFTLERAQATPSAQATSDEIIPDQAKIVEEFKDFLSSKNLLRDQLKNGRSKVFYDQGSQRDSQTAQVTLFQDDINSYPIVSPSFDKGLINGVVTKFREEKFKYLTLDYIYWPVDGDNSSTYPIKKVDQAYDELKGGKGTVIKELSGKDVSITSVYLAYFLPQEYTPYLQPIFVFEGERFVAFLPAITDEYLSK